MDMGDGFFFGDDGVPDGKSRLKDQISAVAICCGFGALLMFFYWLMGWA